MARSLQVILFSQGKRESFARQCGRKGVKMSTMQYTTVKAHIVMNAEKAQASLEGVLKAIEGQQASCGEAFDCETVHGEGFEEALAVIRGAPSDPVCAALETIAELDNGSYGAVLIDGDYGVSGYGCFGDAEFSPADEPDGEYAWASDDFLELRVSMKAGEWLDVLGCDGSTLADEAEARGSGLLDFVMPSGFSRALEEAGLAFSYHGIEPFEGDGGHYESDEQVEVVFELDGHDLGHSAFKALKAAVNDAIASPARPDAEVVLRFTYAEKRGEAFENTMIDAGAFAILTFKSSREGVMEDAVRVLKKTPKAQ